MAKSKVFFIYGPPAVGKLTTAKRLAEQLDYRLLHNHLTADLVRAVLGRGNANADLYVATLRFELLEIALKEKVSGLIMTSAYAQDFIYPNGENDRWFVKRIESITEENGGEFYGVQLVADKATLLRRVIESDRGQWRKISKESVLEDVLQKHDFTKTAPLKKNLVIENDVLSVDDVVERIRAFAEIP